MPDSFDASSSASTAAHARRDDWHASLTLGFAADDGVTRLYNNRHAGPLRVQKALYPEDRKVCHAIVVHPPGGVVGGDRLDIDIGVGDGGHACITTPGAAKWYRANGKAARQSVHLHVNPDAALEWLPQETIIFDQADVMLEQQVELAAGASYIGCEILCFGRRGAGERFDTGAVAQRTAIRREGRLLWWEQGRLEGPGQRARSAADSPLMLGGRTVCATLIAVGKPLAPAVMAALLAAIRADAAQGGNAAPDFGVTHTKGVLVARHLGDDSEAARHLMLAVWRRVRPALLGRAAITPRSWLT